MLKQDAASSDLNIDAGTLFLDVSNNRVGIAETSPSQKLQVNGNIRADGHYYVGGQIVIDSNRRILAADGAANVPYITFAADTNTGLYRPGTDIIGFSTAGSERARIDASGYLLVGKTDSAFTTVGTEIRGGNLGARVIRSNAEPLTLHRIGSSGKVLNIYDQSTETGSLGTANGDLHIDGDTGIRFQATSLMPRSGGSDADATVDLGLSTHRFKDLHLSGTANIVGTAGRGLVISNATESYTNNVAVLNAQHSQGILQFKTASAERMRITKDGNVGIGTSSPNSFVESSRFVVGSGTSGTNEMMFLYSGTNTFGAIGFADGTSGTEAYRGIIGYHHTGDEMFFSTNGGGEANRDVTITSAGNVGIGVSSTYSGAKLSVAGSTVLANGNQFVIGTFGTSGLQLIGTAGGDNVVGTMGSSEPLLFRTASSERMRIDANGNLGFGVTPNANWSSSYRAIDAFGGATFQFEANSTRQGQNFYGYPWKYKAARTASSIAHTAGGDISMQTAPSGSANAAITWTSRLHIKNTGNVGIGTSSPNANLEVLKAGGGKIRISETAARYVEVVGYAEGTANGSTMAFHTIEAGTSTNTERMRINSAGNVGIGTNNPSNAKLEVVSASGEVFRADSASGAYRIVANQTGVSMQGTVSVAGKITASVTDSEFHNRLFVKNGTHGLYMGQWDTVNHRIEADANRPLTIQAYNSGGITLGISGNPKFVVTNAGAATPTKLAVMSSTPHGSYDFYNNGTSYFNGSVVVDDHLSITGSSAQLTLSRTSTDQTAGFNITNNQNGGYGSGIVWNSKRTDAGVLTAAEITVSGENAWNSDATSSSMMQFATRKDNTLTTHMTIRKSGNVGIGVTSPYSTLQVDGPDSAVTAHFGQGQSNGSGIFGGISLGYAENANSNYRKVAIVAKALSDGAARQNLHFLVDTVNDGGSAGLADTKMMIDGLTGNVGIGTESPGSYKLNVNGETKTLGLYSAGTTNLGTNGHNGSDKTILAGYGVLAGNGVRYGNYGSLIFKSSSAYTAGARSFLITNGYGANKFAIIQSSTHTTIPDIDGAGGGANNGTPRLVINNSGLVGIGTTDPQEALQVDGNIRISHPDGGGSPAMTATIHMHGYESRGIGIKMRDQVNSASGATNREWFVGTGYNTSAFGIGYAQDGSQSSYNAQNKLTVAASGFVGIGTTGPAELLHVHNGSSTAAIRVSGEGNNNRKCQIEYNATDGPIIRAGSSGITSLKFTVDNSTLAGKFHTNADFYTNDGTVHSLSDIRVKTDVKDLADGLDIVKQLKPRTFRYTEDSEFYNESKKDEVSYGFVANEVEEVAPQYTSSGKGKIGDVEIDDLKSLSTIKMIPMLVKAIQEQQTLIESLTNRIATLEE